MNKLVLASASPRRVEILKKLGFSFDIRPSEAEDKLEKDLSLLSPRERVEFLSFIKAEDIAKELSSEREDGEDYVVIGSDTVVAVDEAILEKPKDRAEAYRMIKLIAGREHEVYTAVTLLRVRNKKDEKSTVSPYQKTFTEVTRVMVYPITEEEIIAYIDGEEPYDKAGAYAVQGEFFKFIKGIHGDYSAVMGLPSGRLYKELKAFLNQ